MLLTLNRAAAIFRVHPRTILRALATLNPSIPEYERKNPYWAEDYNPYIDGDELALAYGCKPNIIKRMFEKRDTLINPQEAAAILKIGTRQLRNNRPRHLKCGGIVRFERSVIVTKSFAE